MDGNVFTDMTRIVRRAGRELGDPQIVARAAGKVPESHRAMAKASLLADVQFPSERTVPGGPENAAKYNEVIEDPKTVARYAGRPAEWARYRFALAASHWLADEIIALWQAEGPHLQFEHAVTAARWLIVRGQTEAAAQAIEAKVSTWFPVDQAQVAPLTLMVDPVFAPVMTPERCERMLRTPRGDAATP